MIIEDLRFKEEKVVDNSDVWGDSDDEKQYNQQDMNEEEEFYGVKPEHPENSEIAALRRIHAKQGYLAGISSQKEDSLQKGFDDGYPTGADIGIEVGKILGTLQILSTHSNNEISQKAKESLKEAQEELHIRKVLNKRYFDDDLKVGEHPLLTHWNQQVQSLLRLT